MPIQFNCNHCGKKMEAQDSAAGKWAACPACHKKIFVPSPQTEDDDELTLAPIDETGEEKRKRLVQESYQIAQAILKEKTIFFTLRQGDWRPVVIPALAALVCGFFWEFWNSRSAAHWVYSVPYVHRFLIFEMPLLGYVGYLPFGLECVAIVDLLLGGRERTGV